MSAVIAGSVWMGGGGCSASQDASGSGPPSGNGGGGVTSVAGGGGQMMAPGGTSVGGNAGTGNLNPLCGVAPPDSESCVPDSAKACRDYVPPAAAGGMSAGEGDLPGHAGQAGETGSLGGEGGAAGAMSQGGDSTNGGAAPGGAPSGGAAGHGPSMVPDGPSYSCQVTREGNQLTRKCSLAGSGTANAPCFSGADCAPSFACVTSGDSGRCLPYCCDRGTACESGSYCAEQPLRSASSDNVAAGAPRVPVCVPADGCSLEETFPCAAGKSCRCTNGTACMVVRDDGTTACVKPGTGQTGDPCPCAWNHVCSSVTNACVKICRTDSSDADCGAQKCQASAELPPNFGVCVGPLP
jgi:hypothetical protein